MRDQPSPTNIGAGGPYDTVLADVQPSATATNCARHQQCRRYSTRFAKPLVRYLRFSTQSNSARRGLDLPLRSRDKATAIAHLRSSICERR